jgi:hypothetical protein
MHGAPVTISGETMPRHRWRKHAQQLRPQLLQAVRHVHLLHSPGSSLFLLVPPLPPITARRKA